MTQFREMPKENQKESRTLKIKSFFQMGQNQSPEESKIRHDRVRHRVACYMDAGECRGATV